MSWGNLRAMGANNFAGLKSFLGMGGSVSTGAGSATTWGAATMGQKASALGKSNAALAAGAMIAMDGLRRGGKLGVAETSGGGALIGFKFGGPLGAAVGAWIGLWAGIARLFVKGAQEKARDRLCGRASDGAALATEPGMASRGQQAGAQLERGHLPPSCIAFHGADRAFGHHAPVRDNHAAD